MCGCFYTCAVKSVSRMKGYYVNKYDQLPRCYMGGQIGQINQCLGQEMLSEHAIIRKNA